VTQELRNKLYAVAAGVLGILLVLGIVDAASQDVVLGLADQALDLVDNALGLAAAAVAFWKSRPGLVTVVEVPKDEVVEVVTLGGQPNVDADSNPVV
jgi:hypothetical protein